MLMSECCCLSSVDANIPTCTLPSKKCVLKYNIISLCMIHALLVTEKSRVLQEFISNFLG